MMKRMTRYLSVEADGDIYHNLQLFADDAHIPTCRSAAEVAKAYKVKKRNVVFFGPGYHELNDSLLVQSNQLVYHYRNYRSCVTH
jgi:hypothetical protein